MTGIEPVCDQLLFLRLIRLRRYIPIYIFYFCTPSPTRTETQLRMAPKATDYTNSSNGVSQFFDFLFHHVKDLNQL